MSIRNLGVEIILLLLIVGCTPQIDTPPATPNSEQDDADAPIAETAGLSLPQGFAVSIVAEGLRGPTQMLIGPDGALWVAQLAGGENAGTGEVVTVDLETNEQRTLLTGLDKPTGIAVLGENDAAALWIAAGPDLLRARFTADEDGLITVAEPETVLADLPTNGRSNGTLTVTPKGMLLYETSGRRSGNDAQAGSATLWRLDPADAANPQPVAVGLKGAYAHTIDASGRLWTVEIGDDPVAGAETDGRVAPPDELNLVPLDANAPADFGWPRCFGMAEPALNYEGTAEACAETEMPVALFPRRSTPVSVVAAPWVEDVLLVALWVKGNGVVQVAVDESSGEMRGEVTPFINGLENPQHLLVLEDGTLLVSDFARGTIYQVVKEDEG